jgi:hypothetical protein
MRMDHLVVVAGTLAEGVAFVEDAFGVAMAGGGQHQTMGTHNRLLGMGDLYLEVIAVDPSLPAPPRPRWFDMDRFAGPPCLANWVMACDDLAAGLALCPPGTGAPMALARGDLRWQMGVPDDGKLPYDGAFPALIEWQSDQHPTRMLPNSGLRLTRLDITHPEVGTLGAALARLGVDPRITFVDGPAKRMRAEFSTALGPRSLP